jgi:hypothetical protein
MLTNVRLLRPLWQTSGPQKLVAWAEVLGQESSGREMNTRRQICGCLQMGMIDILWRLKDLRSSLSCCEEPGCLVGQTRDTE